MARQESDREDIFAEAAALVRRCEIRVPGLAESVVAGWNASGRLSLYLGSEPVYVFDADARLRRAFAGGCQHRSEGATLARLTKVRTPDETQLVRHDLTESELAEFLESMRAHLSRLAHALDDGTAQFARTIPDGDQPAADLRNFLERVLANSSPLARSIVRR
jgi:hypothetical protein